MIKFDEIWANILNVAEEDGFLTKTGKPFKYFLLDKE